MNHPYDVAIRLLLADDHYVVRSGFAASLELEADFTVVAEAESGEQAVELHAAVRPDVVLMDVRFPGGLDGIEATAAIRAGTPDARILMYSTFDHGDDIYRSLLAGAAGYVLKSAPREEVVRAIRTVLTGERHVQGIVARRLAERIAEDATGDDAARVLGLIARGYTNRQIGTVLQIAEEAVNRHVADLLGRLRERDRAAGGFAISRHGLSRPH